jgi:myo-inositol catabolism protein IolC
MAPAIPTSANDGRHLHLLAFDHRDSFEHKLLGIGGDPTPDDVRRIEEAKRIIFTGFHEALDAGLPRGPAGILVDEEFGATIARDALALGVQLAMSVEKSGQAEFDFEYGPQFGDHIRAFEPTYAKVLVRYNPGGDVELNRRQAARLARLGKWLHRGGPRFLFELLVPAEPEQLAKVDGDAERYDREVRPDLMVGAIRELQDAGVEPDVWKIEGLDAREDCVRVADVARAGGRGEVECIVLGRGGDESRVVHWLQTAAGVPGFVGFAVGRTIWWDPLEAWLAGAPADDAAATIAGNYRRLVDAYRAAEAAAS